MNAPNACGNVDVLKKRFESLQNCMKTVPGPDDGRHEKNANKRIIKRTPAFRRDVNSSRRKPDHSRAVEINDNVKLFRNVNSHTVDSNIGLQTISRSYKTDGVNGKKSLPPGPFVGDNRNNKSTADHKNVLIQCLKKKLENGSANDCRTKVLKKNFDHTPKTALPVGPPPKKPPRTFAHDKLIDPDPTFKCAMESRTNSKSDPKMMLMKLEKFVTQNVHMYGTKDEKTVKQDCNSKKSSKKSNLFSLAESLKNSKSENVRDNSLKIYRTDEQNYLTTKQYCENKTEHIYDEPIFLKPNSRLKVNAADNCHTLVGTNNEWACDSDKFNLHYMSTPIKDYNLNESESCLENDNVDESDSKVNKSTAISHERKIQMLMNEAYGTFTKSQGESDSESISNNEDSSSGSINNLTDKNISEQTLERKGYLRRLTKRRLTSTCSTTVRNRNHLFEALLLIGLDLSSTREKLPYIKYKYPEHAKIPKQIENLCFPDAHVWPFTADDCRSYYLTVTDENGQRYYGYCYRVQPEGAAYCLPLVYCIYSSTKANSFYLKVLQEIESRHGLSEFNMKKFIGSLYDQPFPELGSTIYIPRESASSSNDLSTNEGELCRPHDVLLEQVDLLKLLHIIRPNTFIQMIATMLLERKLILLSKSISLLSSSIEGLTSSLYPFTWQHTLISVLPSQMVSIADFIQAPTPYIIGLLKTENQCDIFSQLSEHDQVFIFDLDANKTLRKVKDEYSVIPSRIAKGLKSVIGLKIELDQTTKAVLASESLIRMFIELIGHYRNFITFNLENKHFQKQFFINAGSNSAHRNFLEWFTETAMFSAFINDKIQNGINDNDVFELRYSEFSLELNKSKRKSKTLQSMKALGDRLKEWAVS